MSDGFGNGQKPVHVISLREHLERDVPRSHAILRHEPDHLSLPVLKRAEVAMKQFFVVTNRLAMSRTR